MLRFSVGPNFIETVTVSSYPEVVTVDEQRMDVQQWYLRIDDDLFQFVRTGVVAEQSSVVRSDPYPVVGAFAEFADDPAATPPPA